MVTDYLPVFDVLAVAVAAGSGEGGGGEVRRRGQGVCSAHLAAFPGRRWLWLCCLGRRNEWFLAMSVASYILQKP